MNDTTEMDELVTQVMAEMDVPEDILFGVLGGQTNRGDDVYRVVVWRVLDVECACGCSWSLSDCPVTFDHGDGRLLDWDSKCSCGRWISRPCDSFRFRSQTPEELAAQVQGALDFLDSGRN